MNFEEKTIKRQEIFKGHIFTVAVDDVEWVHMNVSRIILAACISEPGHQ